MEWVCVGPYLRFLLSRNKHGTKKMYFKPSGGRSQENKNFVKDQYMENLWKSQVFVAHSTVSAELFAETFHPPL